MLTGKIYIYIYTYLFREGCMGLSEHEEKTPKCL